MYDSGEGKSAGWSGEATVRHSRETTIPPIRSSVYAIAREEAQRYKWIESEKAGCDLGEKAIRCWVREHWSQFLRARWIEHLNGRVFWIELDRGDFGLLCRPQSNPGLLDEIVDRIKSGGENLDILCWAHERHLPAETIWVMIAMLETLNINEHRIASPIEANVPVSLAG